ncbi:MAG: GIY-YIG nuclease family protein [Bacillota bacterium]
MKVWFTIINSGVYLLEIYLPRSGSLRIGALGTFEFRRGFYYYSGSAQRGLQARLNRHSSQEKKFHWHIDYLLAASRLLDYYTWKAPRQGECRLAEWLRSNRGGQVPVPGFGASDCRCDSHLIYFEKRIVVDNFPQTLKVEE